MASAIPHAAQVNCKKLFKDQRPSLTYDPTAPMRHLSRFTEHGRIPVSTGLLGGFPSLNFTLWMSPHIDGVIEVWDPPASIAACPACPWLIQPATHCDLCCPTPTAMSRPWSRVCG